MGIYADDCYEAAEQDFYDYMKKVNELSNDKNLTSQQVVNDAINTFKIVSVDSNDRLELLARNILHTIYKKKHVTPKQRIILIKLLLSRGEEGYEY